MDKQKLIKSDSNISEKTCKQTSSSVKDIHDTVTPRRIANMQIVQNFHLVWLDGNIDEMNNQDCCNGIIKLQQTVNTVNTFTDVDECIYYINGIKEEKTCLIISAALGQKTVPIVHNMPQISAIYIFCGNQERHEQWAKQWPKVKGIFTDITLICEAIKQAAQNCDQNAIAMSFVVASSSESSTENLNETNQSLMYTQLLKEIILTIDFEQVHFDEFLTYCREQFVGNTTELNNVDKLEKEYRLHLPIWWYTCPCFLHSILDRALRTLEVELIIKIAFFIRDLHENIAELHSEQYAWNGDSASFTVFSGQGLSQTDYDQMVKTEGGLMSFNNFFSKSFNREVCLAVAESNQQNSDLIGVLFQITIDPSISSTPFANIGNVSYFQTEGEILFSLDSIFRIGQMKQIDGNHRLRQVDLKLASDNDPQLYALTEQIREETFPTEQGWYRLGNLLIKFDQSNKAQQLYRVLLDQAPDEYEKGRIYHLLGLGKYAQGEYTEAVNFYEKSIEIAQEILSRNHRYLSTSYNNIGLVYDKVGDYPKALSSHEKALEMYQRCLSANHRFFATSYNNIGSVYDNMGDYSKALLFYERALDIGQRSLPANHPNFQLYTENLEFVKKKL